MMNGGRISKSSQRSRRNFFKALRNYLTADSYMYGPLIYPHNYKTFSNKGASARGKFWQTKRTQVTLSSLEVHKSLKPDHEVHFRDVPLDSIEKVKHVLDFSASPSTMDNNICSDTPSVTRRHIEKEKRAHQDIDGSSPLVF